MSGNTFGNQFKVTTWGESHGIALGAVIDGCPAGILLSEKDIQQEVDRRKPISSRASTSRKEEDKVQILSGIFEGKTTGTPISVIVYNKDHNSNDYGKIKDLYRPGHADLTYDFKFGFRDYRGGGRSSGRETVARVIAGAIAKKILKKNKIEIFGHTLQIGNIKATKFDKNFIEKNDLRTADKSAYKKMNELITKLRIDGDSIGAIIQIVIKNPPKGLGNPVFDKLSADLAKAMMSIGAIKGIEIGSGFDSVTHKGSENNDSIHVKNGRIIFGSNNAGGILGGISTGQDIIIRLAIKPVSSIRKPQNTITSKLKNTHIEVYGRHDCCLAPRIIPVAEAMAAITILDKLL